MRISKILVHCGLLLIFVAVVRTDEWPVLKCHKWYDGKKQKIYNIANGVCTDGHNERKKMATEQGLEDRKACIIFKFNGFAVTEVGEKQKQYKIATPYKYGPGYGIAKVFGNIFMGLFKSTLPPAQNNERMEFTKALLMKSFSCDSILNDLANVQNLSSTKWGPFYDCLDKAWKC